MTTATASAPSLGAARRPSWFEQALVVLRKDLAIELSTGEVVVSSGFFALLVVILASLSFYGGPANARMVAAGVIWLSVSFAAVLALGKTWQREREEGAL
ncbi:MAG: heme exporter protein CcmB, partial [Myxococcota bacterium]|nr:heme exporter protein CcmB [Myxococcota bacterium]